MTPIYVVVGMAEGVYVPYMLATTRVLKEALEAFLGASALAPHATIALYVWEGARGGAVLRAQDGVWRVEVPEPVGNPAWAHEAVPA